MSSMVTERYTIKESKNRDTQSSAFQMIKCETGAIQTKKLISKNLLL